MTNKISIGISLIKKEYTDFNQIVRNDIPSLNKIDLSNAETIYFTNSYDNTPYWVSHFFVNDENIKSKLFNASSKLVLLIKGQFGELKDERTFALFFGRGKSLINDTVIEDRFGLRTALNLIGGNNIRTLSKTEIAGSQKNSVEQMPRQSPLGDFGFDIDTDLISCITGKIEQGKLSEGSFVTGSDSLQIKGEVDISNVFDFLDKIYGYYQKDDYKNNFEWIDHIKIVKNSGIIDFLDKALVENLNSDECTFWTAVPEIIDWCNASCFKISGISDALDDICLDKIMSNLKTPLVDAKQLKNKTATLVDIDGQPTAYAWSVYKCLFGEINKDGKSYCLNNGKWYEINKNYANKIDQMYKESKICNLNLIDAQKNEDEKVYNQALANANASVFINLDRKTIRAGNGDNPIEVCDVLSRNGHMIHVKKNSGSSVLSHLFNQGLVSATLLKENEPKYVDGANNIIRSITDCSDYLLSNIKTYEVVYAIISDKSEQSLPHLPFFSKISFCSVKKRLGLMGFECSIKTIKKV